MFKPGDKVRCVHNGGLNSGILTVGKIYTVLVPATYTADGMCWIADNLGHKVEFFVWRFELVKEEQKESPDYLAKMKKLYESYQHYPERSKYYLEVLKNVFGVVPVSKQVIEYEDVKE